MAALDIVIVNWNAGRQLQACLDSVFSGALGTLRLDRVVVVDNASSDGSAEALHGPVSLLRNDVNLGFAAACNQGAAGSTADYLLFLNPDTVLDGDSLAGAVAFMEENASVDVSGIRLRDANGRTQRCCARFPTPWPMVAQCLGLDRLGLAPSHFLADWDHGDSRDVDQVMGAFLLIRRAVFQRLRGFDQRFFVYYEDVDLCRRVAYGGGRVVHNAGVSAVHIGGGTTGQIKARRQFLAARSRIQYAAKHFGWVAALPVALAGLVGEPLARLALGALRRSRPAMTEALAGGAMLWGGLPSLRPPPEAAPSILLLTRYPRQGASSRTRFLAYVADLQAAGFDVVVQPFFGDGYLPALYAGRRPPPAELLRSYVRRLVVLLGRRSFQRLWLEKDALPFLPLAMERALLAGRPLAIDFDDAWYLRYAGRPLLDGKLEGLVRLAATVIVGNDELAAWAGQAGAGQIVRLPTAVDADRYAGPGGSGGAPPVVGWIGTPSSARDHLRPLVPLLAELAGAGLIRLTVVGAVLDLPARFLTWSEDAEAEVVKGFDIGIMPLPDDPWSRGKCAYKLIQYMAAGLPVVASPVGMNCQVVEPGINGFLATRPEEWRTALTALAADPDLRRRMGEAGRQRVRERYCEAVVGPRVVALFAGMPDTA